jgi:hypothetical protein
MHFYSPPHQFNSMNLLFPDIKYVFQICSHLSPRFYDATRFGFFVAHFFPAVRDSLQCGECHAQTHSGQQATHNIGGGSALVAMHGCICSMTLDPQGRIVVLSTGVRFVGGQTECVIRRYENGIFSVLYASRLPFMFHHTTVNCIRINSRGEIFVGLGDQTIIKVTTQNFLAPFYEEYDKLTIKSAITGQPQRTPFARAGTCIFEIDSKDRIFSVQNMKFCILQTPNKWQPLFVAPSRHFAITEDIVSFAVPHEHRVSQFHLDGKKIVDIGGYGKKSSDGPEDDASFDRPIYISADKYGTLVVLEACGRCRVIESGFVFTLTENNSQYPIVLGHLLPCMPVSLVLDAQKRRLLLAGCGLPLIWSIDGMRRHVLHFESPIDLSKVINRTDCGPLMTMNTGDASITVHEALINMRCKRIQQEKLATLNLTRRAADAFVKYLYSDCLDEMDVLDIEEKFQLLVRSHCLDSTLWKIN